MAHEKIVILDFGGQYAHLIASRIRRQQVLAEIHQPDEISLATLKDEKIRGIILSGGPQSVYEDGSPTFDAGIFDLGKPVLGICYGHQFMSHALGGEVVPGQESGKEFGRAEMAHTEDCPLFADIPKRSVFWMSHGDEVKKLAENFVVCGQTDSCHNAAIWHPTKNLFGIQFHPEVTHSEYGVQLLKNFLTICQVKGDWTIEQFLLEKTKELLAQIGDRNVFLFVSGGVDSTVCFAFLSKILGPERVRGLFVDTGMMRSGEVAFVETSLRNIGTDLTVLRESDTFLNQLKKVADPEKKRGIIGNAFLQVQQKFFAENQLGDEWVLAQGTIYPDTIESGGTKNASTIKTHHNRVPEIQKLIDAGKVIEPIADLYKDEVRSLGELLGLPHELVWRHPFPGPGLGVRILCADDELKIKKSADFFGVHEGTILPIKSVGVQGDFRTYRHPLVLETAERDLGELEKIATNIINQHDDVNRVIIPLAKKSANFSDIAVRQSFVDTERVHRLQRADKVITDLLGEMELYGAIWQFPVVLVPINFGNKGRESVILRPIDSIDAMSATVGKLPWEFFEKAAEMILADTDISAVFLDITSKPPGTIEWE